MEIKDFRKKVKVLATDEELTRLVNLFINGGIRDVKSSTDFKKLNNINFSNIGSVDRDDLISFKDQLIIDSLINAGKDPYKIESPQEKKDVLVRENDRIISLLNSNEGLCFDQFGIKENDDSEGLEHEFILSVTPKDLVSMLKAIYDTNKTRGVESLRIVTPSITKITYGSVEPIKVRCSSEDLEYTVKLLDSIYDMYKSKCNSVPYYANIEEFYSYTQRKNNTTTLDIMGGIVLDAIEESVREFANVNSETVQIDGVNLDTYLAKINNKYEGIQLVLKNYKEELMPVIVERIKIKISEAGIDMADIYSDAEINNKLNSLYGAVSYEEEFQEREDELKKSFEEELAESKFRETGDPKDIVIPEFLRSNKPKEEVVEEKVEEPIVQIPQGVVQNSVDTSKFVIPEFLQNPNRREVSNAETVVETPVQVSLPEELRQPKLTTEEASAMLMRAVINARPTVKIEIPEFLKNYHYEESESSVQSALEARKAFIARIEENKKKARDRRAGAPIEIPEFLKEFIKKAREESLAQETVDSESSVEVQETPVVETVVAPVVDEVVQPVVTEEVLVQEESVVTENPIQEEVSPLMGVEETQTTELEEVPPMDLLTGGNISENEVVVQETVDTTNHIDEEARLDALLQSVQQQTPEVIEQPVVEVQETPVVEVQETPVQEVAQEVPSVQVVSGDVPTVTPEYAADANPVETIVDDVPFTEVTVDNVAVVDTPVVENPVVETPVEQEELTTEEVQNIIENQNIETAQVVETQDVQVPVDKAEAVIKYQPYMDEVGNLNLKIANSEKTILEFFEESDLVSKIQPTDVVNLHPEIGAPVSGKDFIQNYLVNYLAQNGQGDLDYIINLYCESITKEQEKVKKRSLFNKLFK